MTRIAVVGLMAACSVSIAIGQEPKPAFEVASVRPNKAPYGGAFDVSPTRVSIQNVALVTYIAYAFEVDEARVIAPDWIRRDRYDVVAITGARSSTPAEIRQMVRALLAERFGLKARRETRSVSGFELVRSRQDGTLGPNLREVKGDCTKREAGQPFPCRPE